jgi:diadenosine tetraphosphate (Ap4A) HIT family hydrolase
MNEFALHPQLARDCRRLGRLPLCHVLLHRNGAVPWFILVPEVAERELYRVVGPARAALDREVDAVAAFVFDHFPVEKLNVAAIGNLVPQLHIHVVGRRSDDACWPQPVWGHLTQEHPYREQEVARVTEALAAALAPAGFAV